MSARDTQERSGTAREAPSTFEGREAPAVHGASAVGAQPAAHLSKRAHTSAEIGARNARIIGLALDGHRPADIEGALDHAVSRWTIYATLSNARQRGIAVPRFPTRQRGPAKKTVHVQFDPATASALAAAARHRQITTPALLARVMTLAVHHDLIVAILDDTPASGQRP